MNKQELLRKLRALAKRGVGGERQNAQKKIDELMKKYNISDEELEDEAVELYHFKFSGKREEALLTQIMYKVCDKTDNIYNFVYGKSGRTVRSELGCECTLAQRIEIDFLFEFYKRLYKREEELFYHAFVQKHHLFGTSGGGKENDISLDELMRIAQLMSGLSNETPLRQIPQHTANGHYE